MYPDALPISSGYKIEEKKFPKNPIGIAKGLGISGFGIVEYSIRSESGSTIELRDQSYYVPGLQKYLLIIYPQGIFKSEGYKGTFIAPFHDEQDGYAKLSLKEDKPC